MPLALFILGLVAVLFAYLVHWPVRRPGELAIALFFPAWLMGEMPVHAAILFVGTALVFVAEGALVEPLGFVGIALLLVAGLSPLRSLRDARRTARVASDLLGRPVHAEPHWSRLAMPAWYGDRAIRREHHHYGPHRRNVADVYLPRGPTTPSTPTQTPPASRPILVYIHGGAWILGFRRFQGRLLTRRLVHAGWVVVSIGYRLSPVARWPDHIIDVKRALAWVRAESSRWSGDPSRIAVSGGSAGGHLAALAALTPNYAAWQPGFEAADTSVQACVPWYGVYDLLDRSSHWPHGAMRRLWEIAIMRASIKDAHAAYAEASPLTHLGPTAPPFLIVHGSHDTVVPPAVARAFAEAHPRATYLEVPGAEHAFDVLYSTRAAHAVEAAALWLEQTLATNPPYVAEQPTTSEKVGAPIVGTPSI